MKSTNIPEVKLGLIAVSRDCFPIELSQKRRAAVAAACAAKGESRADDHRVADSRRNPFCGLHIICYVGRHYRLVDLDHRVSKELPVLRLVNGLRSGAQQGDAVFLKHGHSAFFSVGDGVGENFEEGFRIAGTGDVHVEYAGFFEDQA